MFWFRPKLFEFKMGRSMKSACDVRSEVKEFKSYEAGLSLEEIKERFGLEKVVKMASNENPDGMSPLALEWLKENSAEGFRYPQAGNPRLIQALTEYYQKQYPFITAENIFIGNGSDEIIDLLCRVRTVAGVHNVVAFNPCFGLYVTQSKFKGCELRQAPLKDDFNLDLDALFALVDDKTSLVFITSPDNPSGRLTSKEDLIAFAKKLPASCLLVVDEAYIEFAGEEQDVSLLSEFNTLNNVAIMRTFSKVYGLAGMRVGYAFLPAKLANYLWRVRLPFSINILAQEAAILSLQDEEFKQKTIAQALRGREEISKALQELGCVVYPSWSNFLMFKMPEGACTAQEFNEKMLKSGYIIRSLKAYGLPDYLRVSIGTDAQNKEFLEIAKQILAS